MSSTPYRLPLTLPRLRRAPGEGAIAGVCAGIGRSLRVDATLVRLLLIPAAMRLLGDRNWYLPGWLQWLPDLQVEGRPTPTAPIDAPPDATDKPPAIPVGA